MKTSDEDLNRELLEELKKAYYALLMHGRACPGVDNRIRAIKELVERVDEIKTPE